MRFYSLGLVWASWANLAVSSAVQDGAESPPTVKNIAIIGAGAAGSSAAYHLQKYAEAEGFGVNITLFEKTDRVGGRTLTVNAFDSPEEPVELGASIFVSVNHILYNASKHFHLPLSDYSASKDAADDDVTAIWDGESFVYETTSSQSWWWDVTKLWWRYGTSPYAAVQLVNKVVADFLKLYEEPYFPFRSLTQRTYELGLAKITSLTGEQFLNQHKINPDFSREIIQAATRVNYASNLAYIHGLETMVSFATDGAVAVLGGNWKIFHNMVQSSKAALYKETAVTSISLAPTHQEGVPKYQLSTKSSSSSDADPEAYPVGFDNVVIASPWQFSDISAGKDVLRHTIDSIPYTKLHVTLFASPFSLRPGFFGLAPGSKAPRTVFTTLGAGETPREGAEGVGRTGIYSISTLRTAINPRTHKREYLYKIFSAEAVTPSFLSDLLGAKVPETFTTTPSTTAAAAATESSSDTDVGVQAISWYHPHSFYSYPLELPRITFQDPIVGNGLYYTSGIESFISTMETSALMGMNVARLIADEIAGVKRTEVGEEEKKSTAEKTAASDNDEL